MSDLLELTVYPIKQAAALLFSLTFDGVSIGALMLSAAALIVVYRFLVGRLIGSYLPNFVDDLHNEERSSQRLSARIRAKRDADPRLKEE